LKRWSFFLTLGIAFIFMLAAPPSSVPEGMLNLDPSLSNLPGPRGKPKSKSPLDREKERLKASLKKRNTFKDLVDRQEEYRKFFTLLYQKDAAIDQEERIFLDFKQAELQLVNQNVQRLEEQVVANGRKILSMEEDRSKE